MVKAELEYNPYLMKTTVRFNEREPRINSLVEKYQNSKLQEWIREIPDIFYNEMNGFGFDLEFSGTKMDFNQLEKVFRDAGIKEEQVRLFHKNEIGEREQKVKDLESLVKWLGEEPNNDIFNNTNFHKRYEEILEPDYSFIALNGNDLNININAELNVSVEKINSIDELNDVELHDIPILICISGEVIPQLQSIISLLKQRDDVKENQIFFIIPEPLDRDMVRRTIKDLGIKHIHIVDSAFDKEIRDYYYAFPVTDYICKVLNALELEGERVAKIVETRKQKGEITNKAVHETIRGLDEVIESLKKALGSIENRDNVELPDVCIDAQKLLRRRIETWRNNKIMFSEDNAEKYAYDFEKNLNQFFVDFVKTVVRSIKAQRDLAEERIKSIYNMAKYDSFEAEEYRKEKRYGGVIIADKLLQLNEKRIVEQKADFMDHFLRDAEAQKSPVLITEYYSQEWRSFALDTYIPLSAKVIEEQYSQLKATVDLIAEQYVQHLNEALAKERAEKETMALQLSAEEVRLENDIDWITTYLDAIKKIEED